MLIDLHDIFRDIDTQSQYYCFTIPALTSYNMKFVEDATRLTVIFSSFVITRFRYLISIYNVSVVLSLRSPRSLSNQFFELMWRDANEERLRPTSISGLNPLLHCSVFFSFVLSYVCRRLSNGLNVYRTIYAHSDKLPKIEEKLYWPTKCPAKVYKYMPFAGRMHSRSRRRENSNE